MSCRIDMRKAYKNKDGLLKKKYRDRFTEMADWIVKNNRRKSSKKFFNYNYWFDDNGMKTRMKDDVSDYSSCLHTVKEAVEHPCGTVGCIGGWAAVFDAYDRGEYDVKAEGLD